MATTISYSLAPVPKWYIADLVGRPLGGGFMVTVSSKNPQNQKAVYKDAGGAQAWPYVVVPNVGVPGILFDENGAQGPFYWKFDSAVPDDLYDLEIYDADGVLQWTIENFSGGSGGGGGGVITNTLNIQNMITNNVMYRNVGSIYSAAAPTFAVIAPSAHAGLAATASHAGPDCVFIKNNSSATDSLVFTSFAGATPFSTSDTTPQDYLNYVCGGAGSAESEKFVQYPICAGAQNLSNFEVTMSIWAMANGGVTTITPTLRQFFGDGGSPSTAVDSAIQTLTLTNMWTKYVITQTIPTIAGKVIGLCGNSGIFLRIALPLNSLCNIAFTKPSIYLGNITPGADFQPYDQIDASINSPRTGSITVGYLDAPLGYVAMNDGSIGSATSGASTRANIDTFPLYNLLWTSVIDTWAPVATGRGASAVADFAANKKMTLPAQLGRALAAAGTGAGLSARVLGQSLGTETISIADMPAHNHPGSAIGGSVISGTGSFAGRSSITSASLPVTMASQGGSGADGKMPPTTFQNVFIKL